MDGMKTIQIVQFVEKSKVQKSRLGTSQKYRMPILGPLTLVLPPPWGFTIVLYKGNTIVFAM
jgi:hypothetical protein